jgi:hypothetical protein
MAGITPSPSESNPSGQYATKDLKDLKDLRCQLLDLADSLKQFAAIAPPDSADLDGLQQARTRIQQMPYEHLNRLRNGISPSKMGHTGCAGEGGG